MGRNFTADLRFRDDLDQHDGADNFHEYDEYAGHNEYFDASLSRNRHPKIRPRERFHRSFPGAGHPNDHPTRRGNSFLT